MRYLLWTYYAQLSAHSVVATGQDLMTSSRPARTSVIGVLASCLGIERTRVADIAALHDGIGFAVRVDDTVLTPPSAYEFRPFIVIRLHS
jgi:hypothetical protein